MALDELLLIRYLRETSYDVSRRKIERFHDRDAREIAGEFISHFAGLFHYGEECIILDFLTKVKNSISNGAIRGLFYGSFFLGDEEYQFILGSRDLIKKRLEKEIQVQETILASSSRGE